MRDRLMQVAGIAAYILFTILYIAMMFMPESVEIDHVRQQIKEEKLIQ